MAESAVEGQAGPLVPPAPGQAADPGPSTQELSLDAFNRLFEERTELQGRGRVDIARRIEEARLLGDLSENGDYHAAKEEQGKMEGRIAFLTGVLDDSVVKLAAAEHQALESELAALQGADAKAQSSGRQQYLELLLEHAEPVAGEELAAEAGAVAPGSVVELRFEGDDATETYLFGSVEERRDGLDVVSPGSPLGTVLAGAKAGDKVTFNPGSGDPGAGELTVTIISVDG